MSTEAARKDTRRLVNSRAAVPLPLDAGSAARLVTPPGQTRTLFEHPGTAPIFGCAWLLMNLSVRDEQFGDYVPDGVSKWLPCVGSLHANSMRQPHGKFFEHTHAQK